MVTKRRVVLLHWKAEEMPELKSRIKGFRVETCLPVNGEGIKTLSILDPPDLLLICLDRLPSHGHAIGHVYRTRKATRHIPIVFVGGLPEKVAKIRAAMPSDTPFAEWPKVSDAIAKALASPPPTSVPKALDHADRPKYMKLGLRENMRIALLGAPAPLEKLVPDLRFELQIEEEPSSKTEMTIWFVRSNAEVDDGLAWITGRMAKPRLWIFYRRKKLTWTALMETAARYGLAQYKVLGLNDEWAGVAFGRSRTAV